MTTSMLMAAAAAALPRIIMNSTRIEQLASSSMTSVVGVAVSLLDFRGNSEVLFCRIFWLESGTGGVESSIRHH